MKKIAIPLALLAVLAVAFSMSVKGNEQVVHPTMLDHLKVAQKVRLINSDADTYTVVIVNDRYVKIAEEKERKKFEPSTILEIGSDFIVVANPTGSEQTIAAHAIHVITKFPDEKAAAAPDSKK